MFDKFIPATYKNVTREQFITRAKQAAQAVGIRYEWLMSVILVESMFKPNALNASSGASGLIQWVGSTAKSLHGLTTAQIREMDGLQQLGLIVELFIKQGHSGKMHSLDDVIMSVHYPAYMGKERSKVLYSTGSSAYRLNSTFDTDTVKGGNNDGNVTLGEVTDRYKYFVRVRLGDTDYAKIEHIDLDSNINILYVLGIVAAGLAGGYYLLKNVTNG